MKKLLAVFVLLMLLPVSALSDAEPDRIFYDAFGITLSGDEFPEYRKIGYFEPYGLLLSAFSDRLEISVSIEVTDVKSEKAYLQKYEAGVKKYAEVLNTEALQPIENADGYAFTGQRIEYRHSRAPQTQAPAVSEVYVSMLENGGYLVCIFRKSDASMTQAEMETEKQRFFGAFSLDLHRVSSQYLCYLKNAREEDGKTYVTVDFCSVEYDPELFLIYTKNTNPTENEYILRKDAVLLMPEMGASLYAVIETQPDAEALSENIRKYYEQTGTYGIFQILMDENGEILRMAHYNAF